MRDPGSRCPDTLQVGKKGVLENQPFSPVEGPPNLSGSFSPLLLHHLPWPLGSYYGLTVWFPDMIKHLQNVEYASRTKVFNNETFRHITFNFTLENQVHRRGEYFNDK